MTRWERALVAGLLARTAGLVAAAAWIAVLLGVVGMDLSAWAGTDALVGLAQRGVRAAAASLPFAAALAAAWTVRAAAADARLVSDMATGVRPLHVRRALCTAALVALLAQVALTTAADVVDTPRAEAATQGLVADGDSVRWTHGPRTGRTRSFVFDLASLDVAVDADAAPAASARSGRALGSKSAVLAGGGPWVRALAAAALLVLAGYVMLLAPANRPGHAYAALLVLLPGVALGGLVSTIAVWRGDAHAGLLVAAWGGSLVLLVVGCDRWFATRGLRSCGA